MRAFVKENYKFIAKVNPKWWPELVKEAEKHIGKKENDFVVLHSSKLGQHFMMYNSIGKKNSMKKKCVLTNVFVNVKAPRGYLGKFFLVLHFSRLDLFHQPDYHRN